MNKLKLAGHSGCKLEVEKHGQRYVVTKTSKDIAYNARLKHQYEKQKTFIPGVFRAPAVLGSHYEQNGLFQFSMEYINGFTLAEYLKRARVNEIQDIAEKFLSCIPDEFNTDLEAPELFLRKIEGLEQKIDTEQEDIKQAFKRLKKYQWKHTVRGYCHGDLTLENVIWKDGDLYLIDFLDSFYDSWMQDFAKLLFDLECLWSYRHDTVDENLQTHITIFKNNLLNALLAFTNGKQLVGEMYHMALLHVLRILPYTTDEETVHYLHQSVNKLQAIIDSL